MRTAGRGERTAGGAGGRPGRPRSESRRAAVLTAASALMAEGGPKAATMEAIAARAGVAKATVYKWWPSRGAVAMEALLLGAADSWTLPEAASAPEALRLLLRATVRLFTDTPTGPLVRALAADAQADPEVGHLLREQWLGPRRAVAAEILRRGTRDGELRADLDPATTLDMLFGSLYYRLLFAHEPLDELFVGHLVDHLVPGITPGNSRAGRRADTGRTVH